MDGQRAASARDDLLPEVFDALDDLAVQADHFVVRLQPGLSRRRTLKYASNVYRLLHRITNHLHEGNEDNRKKDVEGRACRYNRNPFPHRLMLERPLSFALPDFGIQILSVHLDVATQRDYRETIFRTTPFSAPDWRPKSNGKSLDQHARFLGHDEMPKLVHGNKGPKHRKES